MPRLNHLHGWITVEIDGRTTRARLVVAHEENRVHETAVTIGETPIRSLDQLVIAALAGGTGEG